MARVAVVIARAAAVVVARTAIVRVAVRDRGIVVAVAGRVVATGRVRTAPGEKAEREQRGRGSGASESSRMSVHGDHLV
jgi:hypothetical protein